MVQYSKYCFPVLMPLSFAERNKNAGSVNTTPDAILSPAEPVVWMMLFSRIVVFRNFLPKEIASTAMGMEALAVSPALSARYTVEAPKMIPKMPPITMAFTVNSFTLSVAEMYGLNAGDFISIVSG